MHVTEPTIGLRGILVVDNVATGPAIGGLRMAPDVTLEECFRLARAMTLKNAAAGPPYGGGKSVLRAHPGMEPAQKERLIRGFAYGLRHEQGYIFGPDMGTDEQCMAWIKDEIGRSVGLPRELGGIPLDEIGATGWGMRHATEVALPLLGINVAGARVAVQGSVPSVGTTLVSYTTSVLSSSGHLTPAARSTHGAVLTSTSLSS